MQINRTIEKVLIVRLIPSKVNLIFGTRRVGKTFLLKKILSETAFKTLFLQGEDVDTQQLLARRSIANYQSMLQNVELLVIDEAQVIPEIGKILKLMIDNITGLRVIVTGSSAFDLAHISGEPLTGRAFFYELYPLAQQELLAHENALQTLQNLEDRLIYGGYPELWNLPFSVSKAEYLKDLLSTYLLKDIIAFEGVRNSSKIKDLLRLVAFQVGKEVSLDELGKQLQMSRNTVEKYLDLCSQVFILKKVEAFSRNLRKEITKSARWYFWDLGVRNALINDFRPLSLRNDKGELWENYLVSERLKSLKYQRKLVETYFWRTYDQQEIDWVEYENGQLSAYEFKWQGGQARVPKAFAEAYPDATFSVINQDNYLPFIA
ncbi:MAG: ATP-binding protein [Runella slithyformis]|nr:MAG: ATP-binding protein [Runella slithyformis]TAE95177.1 MAG: ATP-binding protein [Runella slithyformis]TAF29092.1 MAG: ATP-binding protein [Runella slithyformis]TAF48714.1 MAG: ATP-binding protein [Runella slithyformis]TAF80268.1 MAG: ATP-binding protein [Runella slithyformis]